ncbi:concanavalin A-like lectin/glucanase domain-containing protein [Papiliotrema laurentii]|uniref:Concanavalin A-like lectin/glucanase domain-containing protein n=1 Tax=Papiliotrema laurentii TaxID=5418 RepID=A0AAD9FM05_PAPLA|nr:concanavalin A-like lectin/glucanase domain-containing protein [Papiliotrema laurentii]
MRRMSSLSALIVIPLLSSSAVIAHHEVAEPNGPPGELLHSPDPRNSVTSTPNPAADPSEVDPSSTHYPKKEDLPVRSHGEALKERAPGWAKQIEYSGLTFFDGWDFFTAPDPTHGTINYVDRAMAFTQGLAFWTEDGVPGIQAEHWAKTPVGEPRNSVRIHSHALFAGGLFILDLKLMPWGCGVWPAIWLLGYGALWPTAGEIDLVEGIQSMTNNHTTPGCTMNQSPGLFSGTVANPVCDSSLGGSGCSIVSSSNTSYGMRFNELGGGVFAMQWDGAGIKMWNWNREGIPADIVNDQPTPETWGIPAAAWEASTCDPYTYFKAQQIVLNVNLCGDWAGQNYNQYPYCPGTCAEYVSDPANLNNTVMLVNYIRVYQHTDAIVAADHAVTSNNATGAGGPVPGPVADEKGGQQDGGWRRLSVPECSVLLSGLLCLVIAAM